MFFSNHPFSNLNTKRLSRIPSTPHRVKFRPGRTQTSSTLLIKRRQRDAIPALKPKQLTIRHQTLAIGSTTTRKQNHGITSRTSGIKVQTSLRETADDEGGVCLVVVGAFSDDVEFLALGAGTILDGYGDEILTEVAGGRVDEETLS
jgi:hypothetical protein